MEKKERAGPREGEPIGNSEGNRVGNKLGIYVDEVLGIPIIVADRSKIGGDEVSRKILSSGSCEGARYGKPEDGGEDLE